MAAFGDESGALKQALNAIQLREEGDDTGDLEGISTSKQVIRRVTYLRNLQKEYMAEMDLYKEERIALEKKYEEKYQLLYKKRKDIIDGVTEATLSAEEEDEYVHKDAEDKPDEKGIDGFWMQSMGNLPEIGRLYILLSVVTLLLVQCMVKMIVLTQPLPLLSASCSFYLYTPHFPSPSPPVLSHYILLSSQVNYILKKTFLYLNA
jgi:hypothetical protein